ncbi:helix-turn-helix transcriptional regulator [Actinoallomurus sp. NPDC052308]|uniref:helix-turn-helix domain-containing protein n=1 Tax=Actinoallomurus sp. NPDC052308 TaxID=3155530 RepID=UPI00342C2649
MPSRKSPTLRRRRLSAELRRLRAAAGLSSTDASKRLEWSAGKLTRIERGEWLRPNPRDIQDLLDIYGITDVRQREELTQLAREGRQRGWWHPYRDMLSDAYSTYIGLEAEAKALLTFQPLMIPGLLQTADYARAVVAGGPAEINLEEVDRRVEVRIARQNALRGPDPLRLWAIIDEAALHRPVGGPEVMRDQLKHLQDIATLPKVTLQVIPFRTGVHPGVAGGSFAILEFPGSEDPDAVHVDTAAGELFIEEPDQVDRYRVAFQHLTAVALSPDDTLAMIADRTIQT